MPDDPISRGAPDSPDNPDNSDGPDPADLAHAARPTASDPAATGGGNQRATLIAASAAVLVVILVAAFLITRSSNDSDVAVTVATPVTIGDAAGPLATAPPSVATAGTVDGTALPSIDGGIDPTISSAPPNTHPLPAAPFIVLQPKNAGALAVYPSPQAGHPSVSLPNPVQVSANDRSAVGPLVLLERADAGNGWLEVFLPIRPNGSTGFVKAADVTAIKHNFHIEVRLAAFNIKAFNGSTVILDAPIAEATSNTPTPGGLYYTNMLLKPPDPSGPYGTYAYGLSGYSDTLTSFGGGPGQLGIHGTNEPDKMGQKVSHGCVRLRNADIEKLAGILPLGVPVQIFA